MHKTDAPQLLQESIYLRHFGLILLKEQTLDAFIQHLEAQNIAFEIPLKTCFAQSTIEHHSFFLKDPSNNLLEFKYYTHLSAIFGERDFKKVGEQP
ncbi:VOC family protein [Legionella nagasakiensis]|uniref:VOC family protein n=1 Tax=Legionella nagasakiensis TaxID=535290 RepID=UPI001055BB97|nr:VOC family protein [Legionella nagasakiensis]